MHPSMRSRPFRKSRPFSFIFFSFHYLLAVACLIGAFPGRADAGTFAARVSPPNFELKAKPGEVLRRVITIGNEDSAAAHFQIRTADWTLNEKGGVIIIPADQPLPQSSCRTWTRIEKRSLKLAPQGVKQFRFEVHVPENTPDGQCRFAVVITPSQETVDPLAIGNFKFPVAGAIAVIVYVTVGEAKPALEFKGIFADHDQSEKGPMLRFSNNGNAHARPFGSVTVTDANDKKAELIVVPFPILPGRRHDVELMVDPQISGIGKMDELTYPLRLKGVVEWDGGKFQVDGAVD
jgi:fimbrial chaperone protein